MYILGISAFYHDSAACLLHNGNIVCGAQEERFTRIKHDDSFPACAIEFCLKNAGISGADVDFVVFYEKPFLKFERILETFLACSPFGFTSFKHGMPLWATHKFFLKKILTRELSLSLGEKKNISSKLLFSTHHLSHAASAFYPSPFEEAAVLTLDGVGEWTTCSLSRGAGSRLEVIKEISFPHSVGFLYSAFTQYLGFKVNSGEYKVMGLAPYGTPIFADTIRERLIDIKDDGSFRLNMEYFSFCTSLSMTGKKFDALFGVGKRHPETRLTQHHMNVAASIQDVTNEIVVKLAKHASETTASKNLCLAGGVALNCVSNRCIREAGMFDNIWVQPAAGDAGGSLGAALAATHMHVETERNLGTTGDRMRGALLGPKFSELEISSALQEENGVFSILSSKELIEHVVELLIEGKAVGWFQGRMEFGPRALGNRSIIADPRCHEMQKQLNLKVKFREGFRPFAPSVLADYAAEWFDGPIESPYMLMTANVNESKCLTLGPDDSKKTGLDRLSTKRSVIPAVTHVDGSARLQTVDKERNPLFHALITHFFERTGCPMLVNTSFNVRGEPIVCNPTEAFHCFMGTGLDALAIGNHLLHKEDQSEESNIGYHKNYQLD